MGDSDITLYLSAAALLVVAGSVVAFVIAWRVRKKSFRFAVGVTLLVAAAGCSILSFRGALLVGALGVGSLILAGRTLRSVSSEMQRKTES